ncbi:MAG: amino acid kinase [Halobacteriota archaeon]|nr:amino acid kinase [Halobacteriota archaeon]
MRVVIKIGGSLIYQRKEILYRLEEYSSEFGKEIVIIPGGGVFADLVRSHSEEISEDTAHWMAIHAMDQYGLYLADGTFIQLLYDLTGIGEGAGIFILLPYMLLRQLDPLPHSWDVTSDTIAAWVAGELGAEFIKVTDVDGIFLDGSLVDKVSAKELTGKTTCIDKELPKLLIKHRMNCTVVNGKYPERIIDVLEKKKFIGTVILG